MATIIGLILYIAPLIMFAVLGTVKRIPWALAGILLLLAPAVGDLCYVLYMQYAVVGPKASSIVRFALGIYPFALLPLGFWAALIGTLAWLAVARLGLRGRLNTAILLLAGFLFGGVAGSLFFILYYLLVVSVERGVHLGYNPLYPLLISGGAAGALCGPIVTVWGKSRLFSSPRASDNDTDQNA